ncbi:hypothetical protein BJ170DRAFT_710280 [Xylariales sp. AK1849]|nr:hypothetical protein BJ170DRAFT_710280 [Xylariales sp. AK1849]
MDDTSVDSSSDYNSAWKTSDKFQQLADDYMVGWEACDEFEKNQLGLLAANGVGDPKELEEITKYSMFRGIEEWDMTISAAKALKAENANHDSLDGQDILTYLAKIMGSNANETHQVAAAALPGITREDGAAQPKLESRAARRKRKRQQNESHFFVAPAEETAGLKTKKKASNAARIAARKERRRAKRALLRAQLEIQSNSASTHSPPAVPVLQEAAIWYRSNENAIAPQAVEDEDEDDQQSLPSSEYEGGADLKAHHSQSIVPTETAQDTRNPVPSQSQASSDVKSLWKTEVLDENAVAQSSALESVNSTIEASQTPIKRERVSTSKYFVTPKSSPPKPKSPRPPRGTVSAIPFPPLSAPQFGLIQEKVADDPFRLLIAVTFLIRTPGKTAIPTFNALMEEYSTPEALVDAEASEISAMIRHLGLSVVRAAQIQKYARIWLDNPPRKDTRYGVKNYPRPGDASDVRVGEELRAEDQDSRSSAWEIGHMTQGPYAIDSWRIFCRDVLLGRAEDWKGKGREGEFQPEWMRVLPLDKELRACLRWMWMRDGWHWDPVTGEREVLSEDLRKAVDEGRVEWDNTGALQIIKNDEMADDTVKREA